MNLAELQTHVTAAHPDLIASQTRIGELQKRLESLPPAPAAEAITRSTDAKLQIIGKETARLLQEEALIRSRLNQYQSKVDAVPLRVEQLANLTRDYDTARDHYRSLLEKHYSAQMASELEEKQDADRFEVLDPAAQPDHPTSPDRPSLWAGAVFAGFAGAFLIALGREQLDGSIKSEVDLLKIMPADLEIAGLISNISPAPVLVRKRMLQAV